jgi:diaminopimelate epimerase
VRFTKGHGTSNDFVLLPDPDGSLALPDAVVRAICDRRAGIGADGVLRVVRTEHVAEVAEQAAEAEWFMDYRNADGGAVEMCGNGVRVFARYLLDSGLATGPASVVRLRNEPPRGRTAAFTLRHGEPGVPLFQAATAAPAEPNTTTGSRASSAGSDSRCGGSSRPVAVSTRV